MKQLIDTLTKHTIETIRIARPDISEKGANRLIEVHADPRCYPMPLHSHEDEVALIAWCEGLDSLERAVDLLHFEPTQTIRGICRVLARTHLNRSGINDISIGSRYKTLSPRVMQLFDEVPQDEELRSWADYTPLIGTWVTMAHRDQGNLTGRLFDEDDIRSLEYLKDLTPEQARHLPQSSFRGMPKPNWAKVVRGLYTGIRFLERRFKFNADQIWDAIGRPMRFDDVETLSAETARAVREFGAALAPSFYADLGSRYFVKPDTHVIDVTTWALNADRRATAAEAIAFVNQVAAQTGLCPRAVDKYMFFACSTNMYLAGIRPDRSVARKRKGALEKKVRGSHEA